MHDAAFYYVQDWIEDERRYTLDKFGNDADRQHVKEFDDAPRTSTDTWWHHQLDNYLCRSQILGLDTPNGRQALAKFVSTATGMLTAAVEVYGELPEPGVTSGENLTNLRKLEPYIKRST